MKKCGCIKDKFTPYLNSISSNSFEYMDQSIWMDGGIFTNDYEYEVEIYCPYKDKTYSKLVSNTNSTVITAKDLEEEGKIRDDLYCFTATSCGQKVSKTLLFSGNTQCVIDHLIVNGDDRYKELQILLDRVRINVERGNQTESETLMTLLNEKISNIDCGCN